MDKWKGVCKGPEARESVIGIRNGKNEHRKQEVSKGLVGQGNLVFVLK